MLFDSHTHINEDSFSKEEREELIQEVIDRGMYVMDIGFNIKSSRQAIEDAHRIDRCYAVVGVHPSDTKGMEDSWLDEIREMAKDEKVKAIGEIGLDFHYEDTNPVEQEQWFRKQIRLALELGLPISIHSRDADQKTMDILKDEDAFRGKVLLHCFSGSAELAKEYVKLGAMISIAGPVTYKNNKKTIKVVEEIPLEKLLIETDAPYLAPTPHRGERNRPWYVEHTARKIAEIKGVSYEEAVLTTMKNAMTYFDIME
ncbi:MAG: TatD family hydrolase [Clostridia bacterium]|nr:TatD family hydrolase [Clostridia bacterium]